MLAAEQLPPGTPFGSYEITRLLGKGSFGSVYEALKLPLRRRVAIKLLHGSYASDAKIVGRFLREAEAAAQLNHPHIVETFDVGVVEGVPFIAMEFLEGESLKQRLVREGALSITETADILLPVLSAVATVHEKGIVHRDLKPDNIQLEQRLGALHPKVLDFGIAKVDDQRNLSAIGTKLGSPLYMSPEQHDGKVVDARTDLWSLGVVLYQCAGGRVPFQASTLPQLYRKVVMEPTPSLRLINPTIPVTFEAVVMRALQKDPAARFQTAREMGAALFPFASPVVQHALQREFGMNVQLSASGVQRAGESLEPGSTVAWEGPAPTAPFSHPPSPSAPGWPPGPAVHGGIGTGSIDPTVNVQERFGGSATGPLPGIHRMSLSGVAAAQAAPAPGRGRTFALIGVGVVLLLASVGIAAVALSRETPPPRPATAATAATAAPQVRRIRMTALPATASLQLDSRPAVVGALDESIQDDGQTHTIRVSAPGHEPQRFSFSPSSPPPSSVSLTPLAPAPVAVLPSPQPVAAPEVAPPPAAVRSAPEGGARRPRRNRRRDSVGNL